MGNRALLGFTYTFTIFTCERLIMCALMLDSGLIHVTRFTDKHTMYDSGLIPRLSLQVMKSGVQESGNEDSMTDSVYNSVKH